MEYLTWIIEHRHVSAGIVTFIVLAVLFGMEVANLRPSSDVLKAWSMQEAVFYGFCVLAVATYLK